MSFSAAQRWLLGLTRPYRGRLLLATVLLSVHSLVPVALVWLVEGLLDQALTGNHTALWAIPLAIVGLYAVNALTHISRAMITRGVAWELVTANRKLLFERVLAAPIDSHRARQLGATLTHLSDDVSALQYALSAVVTVIQKPITIIGLLISAWLLQPTLSLIAIVALPLLILPMRQLQRWLRHSSASELAARSQLRAVLTDVLRNALTVKLSDTSPFEQQVESANQQLFQSKRQLIWHQAISSPLIELVGALIIALTLTIGGQAVMAGDSSSGELMAFLVAIGLLSAPLKGLGEALPLWHTASAAAERLFPLLQERKSETSSHTPLPAAPLNIELKDLSFAFDQPLFQPISLFLPTGSCAAITGASGIGKSTLLEGIMGQRPPSQGQILLNGIDNSQVDSAARRQRLAMIPQQPGFFNQSIRFNLSLGREFDDAVLWATLEQVGLQAEVGQRGLDAAMLDNGAGWSGGQRRRLAIARALLGQPQVLLIDEPFNGLDADNAERLWQLLMELNESCTLVLVMHEERWAERCEIRMGLE